MILLGFFLVQKNKTPNVKKTKETINKNEILNLLCFCRYLFRFLFNFLLDIFNYLFSF
jgi:hypothetical protein